MSKTSLALDWLKRILHTVRLLFVAFVCFVLQSACYTQTPTILQISRTAPFPGDEGKYQQILREQNELCAKVDCPPYLVLEPQTELLLSPLYKPDNPRTYDGKPVKELWQLSGFASTEERDRADKTYKKLWSYARHMPVVMTSFIRLNYHPDPSRGPAWSIDHSRFLVILVSNDDVIPDGTIFDAGQIVVSVSSADSRAEADEIARALGSQTVVFAVRPDLSFPAKSWIVADPDFWAKPTSEKDIRAVIDPDQIPQ